MLLHSLALDSGVWNPVWEDFAAVHDVIAPDLRGHGRSPWDRRPFGIADLASDVLALLDFLEIERCALLGMSMGGSVAMTIAAVAPDRIARLALCDTTAWYGEQAEHSWAERANSAAATPREMQISFQSERWFSEKTRATAPEILANAVRIFLRTDPAAHAEACRAMGALDARGSLSAIRAATLVVTGEQDYATPPEMGEALAAGIEDAQFVLWPASRHFSVLESPELRRRILEHTAPEHAAGAVEKTAQ